MSLLETIAFSLVAAIVAIAALRYIYRCLG